MYTLLSIPCTSHSNLDKSDNKLYFCQDLDIFFWRRQNGSRKFLQEAEGFYWAEEFPKVRTFAISSKYWNRIVRGEGRLSRLYDGIRESEALECLILVEDEDVDVKRREVKEGGLEWKLIPVKNGSGPAVCDLKRGVWRERKREELWVKWDAGRMIEREGAETEIRFAKARLCMKK